MTCGRSLVAIQVGMDYGPHDAKMHVIKKMTKGAKIHLLIPKKTLEI